jgi:histidinol dehydrogenase
LAGRLLFKEGRMKIITAAEFGAYWRGLPREGFGEEPLAAAGEIIAGVRAEGDAAVRRFAARFDRAAPEKAEGPPEAVRAAGEALSREEPDLAGALGLAADHIRRFARRQRAQFADFEYEIEPGIFTGQRVIPVERAAVYAPGGRFPLVSSVLMGLIPAAVAGVGELVLASPPLEDGLPDRRILAAARLSAPEGLRVFALGGAQAIAALALGTETVPRADVVAGPGNRYVAAAKRLLFGETGIDFIAGPSDVLVIADGSAGVEGPGAADLAAADMLAQAEHDGDARARALVPSRDLAERIAEALEKRLALLPDTSAARASLEAGGLIVIYKTRDEALGIANAIAPEHLELQVEAPETWVPGLKNYGSLFLGGAAAEVLGDYSAGINHTLPTGGCARFTGGLSVRHFLKTVTSLRCVPGPAYGAALAAAERIARAEGLAAHAASAGARGAFIG